LVQGIKLQKLSFVFEGSILNSCFSAWLEAPKSPVLEPLECVGQIDKRHVIKHAFLKQVT
jgi:hypothetical protein